jgi:predicted permease
LTLNTDLLQQDSSVNWSFLEFSDPIQKLKDVKDQLPNVEDLPNMFHSAEEGEYPNIAPYPSSSNGERQPLLTKKKAAQVSNRLGSKLKTVWDTVSDYLNPPMIGGGIAVILGLIPFMRHALFDNAGYLSPISESIKNLGKLYTVLQMFVLGAHLYSKQGGKPAFWPMLYLFAIRFVAMTALGCGAVYGMRQWLGSMVKEDPVLVSYCHISSPSVTDPVY